MRVVEKIPWELVVTEGLLLHPRFYYTTREIVDCVQSGLPHVNQMHGLQKKSIMLWCSTQEVIVRHVKGNLCKKPLILLSTHAVLLEKLTCILQKQMASYGNLVWQRFHVKSSLDSTLSWSLSIEGESSRDLYYPQHCFIWWWTQGRFCSNHRHQAWVSSINWWIPSYTCWSDGIKTLTTIEESLPDEHPRIFLAFLKILKHWC